MPALYWAALRLTALAVITELGGDILILELDTGTLLGTPAVLRDDTTITGNLTVEIDDSLRQTPP